VWLRSDEANIQLAAPCGSPSQRNQYLVAAHCRRCAGPIASDRLGAVARVRRNRGNRAVLRHPDQERGARHQSEACRAPRSDTRPSTTPRTSRVVAHIAVPCWCRESPFEAEKRELSQTEIISYLLFRKSSVIWRAIRAGSPTSEPCYRCPRDPVGRNRADDRLRAACRWTTSRSARRWAGHRPRAWNVAVGRHLGPKTFSW